MNTDEIRATFLDFFKAEGHRIVPSDSLVPGNDPTLLFTGAGMNQFKEQFLGKNIAFARAASSQKCLRTGDLEKVGKTSGHHTFFEMLGNFSFGDYFKKEAILWAWEFMTEVLRLPGEKLWVSVYKEDDEARRVWLEDVGFPKEKIVRLGAKENFWPSNAPAEGPNGPCGPCSEIFYDYGGGVGCGRPGCDPSCDCGRFVEVWNMVFTQFDRQPDGGLKPLPNKNIDTGMGLERLASVIQGVRTNFETDIFVPIIEEIKRHTRSKGERDAAGRMNAIADHMRAVAFAVSDGVMPSNEERGYVIRKLIRRSVLHSRSLGAERPYLYKLIAVIANVMRTQYPELKSRRESISQVVEREEENFILVLENQGPRVAEAFARLAGKKGDAGFKKELAETAFNFYDTYGIPYEVLEEYAEEKGIDIPREEFERLLDSQRELSRKKSRIKKEIFAEDAIEGLIKGLGLKTEFLGYEKDAAAAKVQAILAPAGRMKEAKAGDACEVALDRTPFYGEAGGQVGDKGVIKAPGAEMAVEETRRVGETIVHVGRILSGRLKEGDAVEAEVDSDSRMRIRANHTATHLLHHALRVVLGEHARQAGSVVDAGHLRFDFTHMKKVEPRELERIEDLVNADIRASRRVEAKVTAFDEAKRLGAIALFGEKYGDRVRMVTVGESKELCGGTHIDDTSGIGIFKITSESAVASGVRRIEALTGEAAREFMGRAIDELAARYNKRREALKDAKADIRARLEAVDKTAESADREFSRKGADVAAFRKAREALEAANAGLEELVRSASREEERVTLAEKREELGRLIQKAARVGGASVISASLGDSEMSVLRSLADEAKSKVASGVIVLGSTRDGRAFLVCALTDDLVKRGASASSIIREAAKALGGSGGGRADFAQAGGDKPSNLAKALEMVQEIVKKELPR